MGYTDNYYAAMADQQYRDTRDPWATTPYPTQAPLREPIVSPVPPAPHPDASNQAAGPNIAGEEGVQRHTDTNAGTAPANSRLKDYAILAVFGLGLLLLLHAKGGN